MQYRVDATRPFTSSGDSNGRHEKASACLGRRRCAAHRVQHGLSWAIVYLISVYSSEKIINLSVRTEPPHKKKSIFSNQMQTLNLSIYLQCFYRPDTQSNAQSNLSIYLSVYLSLFSISCILMYIILCRQTIFSHFYTRPFTRFSYLISMHIQTRP